VSWVLVDAAVVVAADVVGLFVDSVNDETVPGGLAADDRVSAYASAPPASASTSSTAAMMGARLRSGGGAG
jgi:hypothetical protein